jgi:hypothetical protein
MSLRPTAFAVAAALAFATPTAFAGTPDQTVEVQKTQAPAAASHADTQGYAQREQQDAKQVANYQGGDTVVIGISGGALIVILIVLLILL